MEETKLGGINAADVLCEQVVPLLRYLDGKLEKYARPSNVVSYVELVRNRMRAKVAAATVKAERVESLTVERATAKASVKENEKRLQESEMKCVAVQRRLAEEIELQKSSEKACESLWTDIETIRRATVDLRDKLEASRVTFDEESHQVNELTADLVKKNQAHTVELAAKAKELAECEAARSSKLEQLEKLKAICNEKRSQRLAAEEQLGKVEAKLLKVEERNRQLAEQTNDALTKKVNRCLRGFVIWQTETQK